MTLEECNARADTPKAGELWEYPKWPFAKRYGEIRRTKFIFFIYDPHRAGMAYAVTRPHYAGRDTRILIESLLADGRRVFTSEQREAEETKRAQYALNKAIKEQSPLLP